MRNRTLFNTCPEGEFFGRSDVIGHIIQRASLGRKDHPGLMIVGRRWSGKTEVLRRAHGGLFWDQAAAAPVYYQFRDGLAPADFAADFLKESIKQYAAFRRRRPEAFGAEVSFERLERAFMDDDSFGAVELIRRHRDAKKSGDLTALLRNAFQSARVMTERSSIPVYLLFDDLDRAMASGEETARELSEALSDHQLYAASGGRALEEDALACAPVEFIRLDGLDEASGSAMMMELCRASNIGFDPEVVRAASARLEGNPMYMKSFVRAAFRMRSEIASLKDLADVYVNELFEGNVNFMLRSAFKLKTVNELRVLYHAASSGRALTEDEIAENSGVDGAALASALRSLASTGFIEAVLGSVRWAGDAVARDFVTSFYETRVKGRSLDEVKAALARSILKAGFSHRGLKIRPRLKEEVSAALKSFDSQKVLKAFFRNRAFAPRFKNGAYSPAGNGHGEEEIALPQIIGSFDSTRWEANESGPPILIANGFQNGRYDSGNEVVWIAAVKEALSPVNLGDAEGFIRRSQILKDNFRGSRLVRWMVGKDGFTEEASRRLDTEGVYASDMNQLSLLRSALGAEAHRGPKSPSLVPDREYEVVLPSSTKSELVAVKAVEEIGTEMGFADEAIGQIKAALVEACINAFEHSGTKGAKVYLKFVIGSDRLAIHVSNGGVDFDSPASGGLRGEGAGSGLPPRRGWGIELMKGLMDELKFERVSGGARIVMVKYLIKKVEENDGKGA